MPFNTPGWDQSLMVLINQQGRNPLLDVLMPAMSWSLWLWAAGIIALAWLAVKKGPRATLPLLVVLLAVLTANTTCDLTKDAFGRLRPLNAQAGVHFKEDGEWRVRPPDFVPTKERGTSYPSAHAANSMAAAVLVMLLWPKLAPWLVLFPLLTGYSRVYLGKHYPSDVLAGWLLGLCLAGIFYLLWKWIEPRLKKQWGTPQ